MIPFGVVVLVQADTTKATRVAYDTGPMLLVAGLLVLLALLFWLMLYYSHRLEQSGYAARQIKEALYPLMRQRLLGPIDERWNDGGFHREVMSDPEWTKQRPEPPPPQDVAARVGVQEALRQLHEFGRIRTLMPGSSNEETGPYIRTLRAYGQEVQREAQRRRDMAVQQAESKAMDESSGFVRNTDIGTFFGRGPEFVLQFTAVVTIVFAVFGLNVLQQLHSEQAGTILAAIAGYVLGQAARREPRPADSQRSPTPPRPPETSAAVRQPPGTSSTARQLRGTGSATTRPGTSSTTPRPPGSNATPEPREAPAGDEEGGAVT